MIEILRYFTDTFLRCSFMDEEGNIVAFATWLVKETKTLLLGTSGVIPEEYLRSRRRILQLLMIPEAMLCKHGCSTLHIILNFKDEDPEYAEKCLTVAKALYDLQLSTEDCIKATVTTPRIMTKMNWHGLLSGFMSAPET